MTRRRLLYVQRDRLAFPLDEGQRRKWDALSERFEVRVLCGEATGEPDARFVPAPSRGGPAFYLALPFRVVRESRSFRPDVVIAQSAYEGAVCVATLRRRVVVDVHGDWRTSTRAYGSPLRRIVAPVADAVAALALRRAGAIRTVSSYTTGLVRRLGREPAAEFPAYSDLEPFRGPPLPLPDTPRAVYVGALERVKNVDVLAASWRRVVARLPEARLAVVGSGSQEHVVRALTGFGVTWEPRLPSRAVAAALDAATVLVLPSASEGFGRVVVEAYCRGRPVVASRVGSLPDLVDDGVSGLLVEPGDACALAEAIERVLSDRALAERLGAGAAAAAPRWALSAEEHAQRTAELVERVLA